MKNQFVTYEIALKLKELGFDEECFGLYSEKDKLIIKPFISKAEVELYFGGIIAPLWQQAMDFFREEYNYHIDITFREVKGNRIEGINSVYFDIEIYHLKGGDAYKIYKYFELSDNYYYTRKEAILKAIELCQNKK